MKRFTLIALSILICLAGCWNNQELDDVVLVQGVGLSKTGDESKPQIKLAVEIIKPSGQSGHTTGNAGDQGSGNHIVLEHEANTTLEGARELISYAKRRLHFEHNRVYIINDELAKEENFSRVLDLVRRDRILRLNSYLFMTEEDPIDILSTPTLYENLTSNELVSALDQTKYASEFSPIMVREYFKKIEGPIQSAYIPMIKTQKNGEQEITLIEGTAVIDDGKMVGKLNEDETVGLNYLLDQVKGGSITVTREKRERISLEIKNAKTKTIPHLNERQLKVDIETTIEGTLADNMTPYDVNEAFFKSIEKKVSERVEKDMRETLNKLQALKADITNIGIRTYQESPTKWHDVKSEWDNIFANADISIHVDTNIIHEGLINKSIEKHQKRPDNNPYRYFYRLIN